MRIGINIDAQFVNMTGIQHYVDSLIGGLYELKSPHEICAFAGHLPAASAIEDAVEKNPGTFAWRDLPNACLDIRNPTPSVLPRNFREGHPWLASKIRRHEERALRRMMVTPATRSEKYDVLHTPEAFDMRCRTYQPRHGVATIPDLTPLLIPGLFPPQINLQFWKQFLTWADKHCETILVYSQSAKNDVVEHLKIAADRVFVAPLAGRSSTRPVEDSPERQAILKKWRVDETPFLLYAGTLEPRKNLERLVRAFAQVMKQDPSLPHKLILAGGKWERHDLELRLAACENGVGGRVIPTGYVTNDELNALMSACDGFTYVSIYEGFGMPPLEAMTCGAPVLSSNTSSLPEVVGDAGLMVAPEDEESIAAAIYRLVTYRAENARLRRLSLARATEFNWKRTAELSMRAYEAAAAS